MKALIFLCFGGRLSETLKKKNLPPVILFQAPSGVG